MPESAVFRYFISLESQNKRNKIFNFRLKFYACAVCRSWFASRRWKWTCTGRNVRSTSRITLPNIWWRRSSARPTSRCRCRWAPHHHSRQRPVRMDEYLRLLILELFALSKKVSERYLVVNSSENFRPQFSYICKSSFRLSDFGVWNFQKFSIQEN